MSMHRKAEESQIYNGILCKVCCSRERGEEGSMCLLNIIVQVVTFNFHSIKFHHNYLHKLKYTLYSLTQTPMIY